MAANSNVQTDVNRSNNSFIGPSGQRDLSLSNLASKSLDDYCPNWNDCMDPRSYLIPPIFTFKNPEVSDAIVNELPASRYNSVINDRKSDEAECLVFVALQQIIDDGLFGPFLAFRGADLKLSIDLKDDGRLKGDLVDVFPTFNWSEYQESVKPYSREGKVRSGSGEYDFILIGPKFGIVYIEVKSHLFRSMDNFREDYLYGVKQLAAAEAFFRPFLSHVTEIEFELSAPFTKVLFCPNFKREQYNEYVRNLSEEESELIKRHTDYRLFEENGANRIDGKPAYFSIISQIFDILDTKRRTMDMRSDVWYPAYGRIIAYISSRIVFKKRKGVKQPTDVKGSDHFAKAAANLKEDDKIVRQCPKGDESVKHSPHSTLVKASDIGDTDASEAFKRLNVVYLSPDQLAIMNGPNRQFIIGPAGTGKTILLQAKALEVIEKGGNVCIVASENTHGKWNSVLVDKRWSKADSRVHITNLRTFISAVEEFSNFGKMCTVVSGEPGMDILRNFCDLLKDLRFSTDTPRHFFIDDAMCSRHLDSSHVILVGLFLMAISRTVSPTNVVWIAFDPNQVGWKTIALESQHDSLEQQIIDLFGKTLKTDHLCSQSILRQVMRCSGNIYKAAYTGMEWPRKSFTLFELPNYNPVLAHKVMGGELTGPAKESCETYNDGLTIMSHRIVQCIERHANLDHIGVVLGGTFFTVMEGHVRRVRDHLQRALPDYDVTSWSKRGVANKTVAVDCWSDVSSDERPLVIYVVFRLNNEIELKPLEGMLLESYIARTRAVTALEEIEITLLDDNDSIGYIGMLEGPRSLGQRQLIQPSLRIRSRRVSDGEK